MRLVIDESAVIDAPPARAWSLFADLASWPVWNPTCRRAAFVRGAPWTPGSRFRMTMRAGPVPLTAQVEVAAVEEETRSVVWRGGRFGVRSVHRWEFLPIADGRGTLLRSHEVFTGVTLPLLRLGGLRCLVGYLSRAWLAGLKKATENERR